MPDASLTSLDIWVKAGSICERSGEEGLAHFLEHMVFKGSKNLKEGEFDKKIEALGGSSNAETGFDDVHYYVSVPSNVIEPALELLLSLVITPLINEDAFETERQVVLEEIAQHDDQPDEQIIQKLLETCWPNHAYGRPILGCERSLKSISPRQMKSFHKQQYQGDNCTIAIAGNYPNNLENILEGSLLASLESDRNTNFSLKNNSTLCFQAGRKEIYINRLETARVIMAWPIPPANEQLEIMGADIATSFLSEGRRSRLVKRLREELQIVESIDMDITILEKGGLIMLEACCVEEQVDQVEKEINKVLIESSLKVPSSNEINRAYQLVKNYLCFSLETSGQIASVSGAHILWGREQELLEPIKHIDYWSKEKLQKEILQNLHPDKSCTLIARPK